MIMIQANELRIRNYVELIESPLNPHSAMVKPLFKDYIEIISPSSLQYKNLKDYQPIPLTEEWLVKFGFKRLGKDTFYLGAIKIHHRKRGFVLAKRYRDVQHVHQMQNLHFALTGEELTIKE